MPRRPRSRQPDEPAIEPDDGWVEFGGELLLAMGTTEGGAPFGVTVTEFRQGSRQSAPHSGWARALHALERVAAAAFGREVEVGFVKFVGSGLSRDAYRASLDDGRQVFALVPNSLAAADYDRRAVSELRLLAALGGRPLGIRVPRVLGALRDSGGLILVEEQVDGVPLDLRVGRQGSRQPWVIVADVAAQVHALPVEGLAAGLLEQRDCRSHGESVLASVGSGHPLLCAAREWLSVHLPPREPGALLHGDLLGQNVLLGFEGPPGVIDWEYAQHGDPASELAIITRGVRQPFQLADGLERLLDAYSAAGGRPLGRARVGFFELGMLAGQFEHALEEKGDVMGTETRLRALLKRLAAC